MSLEDLDDTAEAATESTAAAEDLRARVDLLEEENRRLREEHARARRSQYRRTAAGLVLVGLLALGGAALFPVARTVLIALGGIGVFAGLLTYYLTPERFVAADVGERVYRAYAANGAAVVADLGLADERVYVPTGGAEAPVRLFVPQQSVYTVPDVDALDQAFVVTDDDATRGLSFEPSGQALYAEFERAITGELGTVPATAARQLGDGLVEQFELVDSTRVDAGEDGRITVGVSGSAYGTVDRFDHPVVSFLAVGLAHALDRPVSATVAPGDDRADHLVTLRWDAEGD